MKYSTAALFVLGMVVGAGGMYFLKHQGESPPLPSKEAPPGKPARVVSALGRIQPNGGVISLGVTLPDLLAKLFVEEGQEVKEGETLAELSSRSDRQSELDLLDQQIK